MTSEIIGILGLLALFALLLIRMPIGLAMVAVGIGGNFILSVIQPHFRFLPYLKQFKTLLWTTVSNYELSVVPLFILMGALCAHIGLSRDLFAGIAAAIGRARGGLPMAAVGACAGFGAVCGSSLATASTMGRIALPELRRQNYAPGFAAGVLSAGGTLGILIPPSVVLVIYAIIVEASVIDMFRAAFIPGILAVVFFLVAIFLLTRLCPSFVGGDHPNNNDSPRHSTSTHRRAAIINALPVLFIFGGIITGLGLGLFTPTPAAAVGVFIVLAYGVVSRRLTRAALQSATLTAAVTTAMIAFILFGAETLKGFFTRSNLPAALSQWAQTTDLTPLLILLVILAVFVLLGCFMDSLSMVLVMVPFFWPVLSQLNGGDWTTADAAAFGMDAYDLKIWFGILCLVVVELGLITPPVGLNVYVIGAMAKDAAMTDIFVGVSPFIAVELLRVGILIAFPAVVLFLPQLL